MEDLKSLNLTLEDGRRALAAHVLNKGYLLKQKYGNFINKNVLDDILKDPEFVRFPVEIKFDSSCIPSGLFACVYKVGKSSEEGFVIYVHDIFEKREGDLAALVLYHLVSVNYGDFASYNEAEEFASAALGMEKEYYYQYICRLADEIPQGG